jgi:hypothetical protein
VSNANKAKGDRTELEAVTYLQETFGRAAFRPHQEGHVDVGDIHIDPCVVQSKNWSNIPAALNAGVAGANQQALAAGKPFGVAWIKKRGKGAADARVAMDARTFRDLLARLRRAEALLARHAPEVFHTEHLPPPPEAAEQVPPSAQT